MSRIYIITGGKHAGKTTYLQKRIVELRSSGKTVAGIVSRGDFLKGKRHNFYTVNIDNQEEKLLMSADEIIDSNKIGKFYFSEKTFVWGQVIIEKAILSTTEILVLDEIGRLELEDKGWANILSQMLKSDKELYLVFRKEYVLELINKFSIADYQIVNI